MENKTHQDRPNHQKKSISLEKLNTFLIFLICTLLVLLFYFFHAYDIPFLKKVGIVITWSLFLAYLIASFTFKLHSKHKIEPFLFNLCLFFILFKFADGVYLDLKGEQSRQMVRTAAETFENTYGEYPGDPKSSPAEWRNQYMELLSNAQELTEDSRKRKFAVFAGLAEELLIIINHWEEASQELLEAEVLDILALEKNADYDKRKATVIKYRNAAKIYKTHLDELDIKLLEKLEKANVDFMSIKQIEMLLNQEPDIDLMTTKSALQAQIEHADYVLAFLDFLEVNKTAWHMENAIIEFTEAELALDYNILVMNIMASENKLEQLNQQLLTP